MVVSIFYCIFVAEFKISKIMIAKEDIEKISINVREMYAGWMLIDIYYDGKTIKTVEI